jgi:hypothetical protein
MAVKFNPSLNFSEAVLKAAEEKFRSVLSIMCIEHKQTPHLAEAEGKLTIETCCEGLDKQVREAMEK